MKRKSWRSGVARCLLLAAATIGVLASTSALAVDRSEPAILQMFEAKWTTIENRMADIFESGYGQMWLPPPRRGDGRINGWSFMAAYALTLSGCFCQSPKHVHLHLP